MRVERTDEQTDGDTTILLAAGHRDRGPERLVSSQSVRAWGFTQSRGLKSSGATGGERTRTQAASGGERRRNVRQGLKTLERGGEIGSRKAL